MRNAVGVLILTGALGALPTGVGFAGGGGPSAGATNGPAGVISTELGNASAAAKDAYYSGLRAFKKAQWYDADAAKASSPEKGAKLHEKAQNSYRESIAPFIQAISIQPKLYEAWNCLGTANRQLGNFEDSASAYSRALELKPADPGAIEGRGEAYLGLNMVDEAKSAYLALVSNSRQLAGELMAAMRRWVDAHPQEAQDLTPSEVSAFARWVNEGGVNASLAN
jgi:tetratricopeptide (TPR) repeat protein